MGKLKSVDAGPDSHTVQADVDFEDDSRRNASFLTRGGERFGLSEMVDRDDRVRVMAQRGDSFDLRPSDYHVGNEDVANSASGHDFRLRDLRTGDPDGSCGELFLGNYRSLVAFLVRSPLLAPLLHERGHPVDVVLHQSQIDAQDWGVEVEFASSDSTLSHSESPHEG